jgi:hypothetical protein
VDSVKDQYYPIDNYEDHFIIWTTLWQEKRQIVSGFTNTFHTLCAKMGIKDSEQHLVLKYCGALHRHIQTEMDFLNISSLGSSYRYVVKIEQKLGTRINGSLGQQIQNNQIMVNMDLINNHQTTNPRHKTRMVKEI